MKGSERKEARRLLGLKQYKGKRRIKRKVKLKIHNIFEKVTADREP